MNKTVDIVIGKGATPGTCVVKVSPPPITGAKKGDVITWNIKNNDCSGKREVGVDKFKHRDDHHIEKFPLKLGPPPILEPGAEGQQVGTVKQLPKKDLGKYKYDIVIDKATAEDPELEIDG